jgi:protein phosphatase
MKIVARGITDVGKKRDHNEDSFLVDVGLGLFVVADGMGGHAGGGTASRLAVETIEAAMRTAGELEEGKLRDALAEALARACRSVYGAAQADPSLAGMGTTVTAAAVAGPAAVIAHVGDSRCYLVRGGRIHQVSEDHSLVNEQLKAGAITADEARHSRFRNIITRSVGFEEQVQIDMLGFVLEPQDQLVLCSDGLSNLAEDREILEVVTHATVEEAPARLVDLANSRGGDDNITVILVRAEAA